MIEAIQPSGLIRQASEARVVIDGRQDRYESDRGNKGNRPDNNHTDFDRVQPAMPPHESSLPNFTPLNGAKYGP